MAHSVVRKLISSKVDSILPDDQSLSVLYHNFQEVCLLFKIIKKNCCGLDVHKTWIFACIGITDSNDRTEYKQARFSSFSKGLQELCDWLAKYNCKDVCMESTGKYWIPVYNILEINNLWVTLSHPKYTKPMKGNKTDFHDGDVVSGIYEDCSIRLKQVRETDRDVLRLIIPDAHNRFPEDENCTEPYKYQELKMFEN